MDNIFSIDKLFIQDYRKFEDAETSNFDIPDDISLLLEKVKKDYLTALPYGNAIQSVLHKQSSSLFGLLKRFREGTRQNHQTLLGKNGVFTQGIPCYYKSRKDSMEKSHYSLFKYSLMKLKTNRMKRKMADFYNSLAEKPDYNQNYVVCYLHYRSLSLFQ